MIIFIVTQKTSNFHHSLRDEDLASHPLVHSHDVDILIQQHGRGGAAKVPLVKRGGKNIGKHHRDWSCILDTACYRRFPAFLLPPPSDSLQDWDR